MTRDALLARVRRARTELERVLSRFGDDDLTAPGVVDGWSVKDVVAHLTAWERRLVAWLEAEEAGRAVERPEPGATWDDLDRLNERDFRHGRDRSLAEVLAEARATHAELVARLDRLSDEELTDPGRYAWTHGNPLWKAIRANTYRHYDEHLASVRAWFRSRAGAGRGAGRRQGDQPT